MSKQRPLTDLPPEIVQALEEGRAIDEELTKIVQEREKLDQKENTLLAAKSQIVKKAGRGNARPETPGLAGEDTGGSPMSSSKNKGKAPSQQARCAPSPQQLSLFAFEVEEKYSQFIELYNEIPKYVYDAPRDQQHLDSIKRTFTVDGVRYKVVLHPARVEVTEGTKDEKTVVTKELFIGAREDLIEDALLKVALDNNSFFTFGCDTRVAFVLEQIYQELKATGHTFSRNEIKEALSVLRGASMIIDSEEGGHWEYSTYPELVMSDANQGRMGFVQLHPLASESIRVGHYRRSAYALLMSLPGRYTRRIGKILDSKFTWAELGKHGNKPYTIHLVHFLGKYGFKFYARLSDNAKSFKAGLEILKKKGIVRDYVVNATKVKGKTVDYTYDIEPGHLLVANVHLANSIRRDRMLEKSKTET